MNDYRISHEGLNRGLVYDERYGEPYPNALWLNVERPLLAELFSGIGAAGARSCLDFACGTGRISEILIGVFPRVVGVDVSADMLEVARGKCRTAEFVLADITKADPIEDRFDVVSAFRFFANAEPSLRRSALTSLVAHMRPGGFLVVNNHQNLESPIGRLRRLRTGHHRPFMSPQELPTLIAESGLRLERTLGIGYLPQWRKFGLLSPHFQASVERRLVSQGRHVNWALNIIYVARLPEPSQ